MVKVCLLACFLFVEHAVSDYSLYCFTSAFCDLGLFGIVLKMQVKGCMGFNQIWKDYEVSRYKDRIAWSLRWFHNKQLQRLHVNMLYQGNGPWFSEMVNFPMFGVISD